MKKATIKIFVSNRIDRKANQPSCKLFIPVRCGAVYDVKRENQMLGDDTGDSISCKRDVFSELTVLYWAWKNQNADYIGLCHYRRFLSFREDTGTVHRETSDEHSNGCICINALDADAQEYWGLTEDKMRKGIEKYDAIFMEPLRLKDFNLKSNYDAMSKAPDWHSMKDVDLMLDIIRKKFPSMHKTACEYMYTSGVSYLYNCFIMKQELFSPFCEWLFGILFELEHEIDFSKYSDKQRRVVGTLGERLIGIYELWLEKKNKYKIGHVPLLFITNALKLDTLVPVFPRESNVVIASNFSDSYAKVFGVFLQSVIAHSSPDITYDFIVISDDISEMHKHVLKKMLPHYMSIRFTGAKPYLEGVPTRVEDSGYSEAVYSRPIIPHILSCYDKVLIVDADMVCLEDIANIFKVDISGYMAAAVKDIVYMGFLNGAVDGTLEYSTTYMQMEDPYLYVNTGLLLLNCEKYRELYSLNFLKKFIKRHNGKVRIYDQDMLNMLLYGKIKFLDVCWNLPTIPSNFIKKCIESAPWKEKQRYEEACSQEKGIVHYASRPKPWVDAQTDRSEIWWQYARKCPFYEEILQSIIPEECLRIRSEFANFHCPNINNRFALIEEKLNLICAGTARGLYLKNKLKSIFCFWNRRRYRRKCEDIRRIFDNINNQ